jgi:mono/diheme cytochrome c family protein
MLKKTISILVISTLSLMASDGKALLEKNCASCHTLDIPTAETMPTFKAPAMEAVGLHLKLAMNKREDIKSFIFDYVLNPDASKSVCESNKVQKFGVMPSQKGKVSKEDLDKIANYIIEHYPTKEFSSLIKEMQTNGKLNSLKNSPFLINKSGLPHLTKLLIESWDKAKLGLSKDQKEKLLVVRKTTLAGVKKIKMRVNELENSVIEELQDGKDPKDLKKMVDEIAKLKAEGTMLHLKCISDTVKVLNDEQIEFLVPFGNFD